MVSVKNNTGGKKEKKLVFFCQKCIRTLSKCDGEPWADLPKGLGEGLGEPLSPAGRGREFHGASDGWDWSDPNPVLGTRTGPVQCGQELEKASCDQHSLEIM